jgi:hypothetical protein
MDRTINYVKILEKKDVIEQILWADFLSDEDILKVIVNFYENLVIVTSSVKSLFKLLISFEKIELFDMLVDYCSEILETGKYGFRESFEILEEEDNLK